MLWFALFLSPDFHYDGVAQLFLGNGGLLDIQRTNLNPPVLFDFGILQGVLGFFFFLEN